MRSSWIKSGGRGGCRWSARVKTRGEMVTGVDQ